MIPTDEGQRQREAERQAESWQECQCTHNGRVCVRHSGWAGTVYIAWPVPRAVQETYCATKLMCIDAEKNTIAQCRWREGIQYAAAIAHPTPWQVLHRYDYCSHQPMAPTTKLLAKRPVENDDNTVEMS